MHMIGTAIEATFSVRPPKKYCDVTGLEAKYTDPRTRLHYRSHQEFHLISGAEFDPALVQSYLHLRQAHTVLK